MIMLQFKHYLNKVSLAPYTVVFW